MVTQLQEDEKTVLLRELLYQPLEDLQLSRDTQRRLIGIGMMSIGDLVLTTAHELKQNPGVGLMTIICAVKGLRSLNLKLRDWNSKPKEEAIRLFGGIEHVPAHMMTLWVPDISTAALHFLRDDITMPLGELGAIASTQQDGMVFDGVELPESQRRLIRKELRILGLLA